MICLSVRVNILSSEFSLFRLCLKRLMIKLTLYKVSTASRSKAVFSSRSLPSAVSERTDSYIAPLLIWRGFCRMHVNELVRLNWVSQSRAMAPEKWVSKSFLLKWVLFGPHGTLHEHFTVSSLKTCGRRSVFQQPRSGDVLRGCRRIVCERPEDGDRVERPLLGLLSAAVTGDYSV